MARWVWREARDYLGRVMPGSTGFLLDQIEGIPSTAWTRFRVDEDDILLAERLTERVGTDLGNDLFVVTDASWRPDIGPFMVPSWHLSGLVREHVQITGEPFFTGDLVILSPENGALIALHRAGLIALAYGTPSPRPPQVPIAYLSGSTVFANWPAELEWRYVYGQIYPDAAVTLPSGRVIGIRWFETDARVSFTAPAGDFQISYRGAAPEADAVDALDEVDELEDVYEEFLRVAGLDDRDVVRLPAG